MTGTGPAGRTVREELSRDESALCVGSPMVGKAAFLERFVTERLAAGDVVLLVETDPGSFDLEAMLDGADVDPRLAVTTLDGPRERPEGVRSWETISSPGDLTGLGISVLESLDQFAERPPGVDLWVVLDSINTIDAYTDDERLFQFLHALTARIAEVGGRGLFTLHEGSVSEESIAAIEAQFARRIEFEETDDDYCRLRLVDSRTAGPWYEVEPAPAVSREPAPGTPVESGAVPESLAAALDRLRSSGQTLTIYDADPADADALAPFFEQYAVEVETARSDPDQELRPFSLLSRERDPLAVSPLRDLRTVVELGLDDDRQRELDVQPDVLEHLDQSVFGARDATRPELIRASRNFELAALREGDGVLRAGFQRLSRFATDDDTVDLYRQLIDAGVEVHLYGVPDRRVTLDGAVVHAEDTAEVADSWFVVYDGSGDPVRSGVLLCQEQSDGYFDGLWTHDPAFASSLDRYLSETYPVNPAQA